MALSFDQLLTPAAYPHPVAALEKHETPLSLVILTGSYAYKIKKSVHLDYVDTTTLERRHHLCEEELRLNQRLAAGLYLEVVPITREAAGLRVGGQGTPLEYAVKMRQFDRREELSALLERGEAYSAEIVEFADDLAEFHARAATAFGADFHHTEQLCAAVRGNLATLMLYLDTPAALGELGSLIDWTHDTLRDELPHFRAREAAGRVRECHGDLHARNIVRWRGRLTAFDCLEFSAPLRWIDTMSDVAFLFMDLAAHDRWDLAMEFMNAYLARTGDYGGVRQLCFYAAYRALVRAMVDGIGREQRRAAARIAVAAAFRHRPRPLLVLLHGPSGAGKSWLSARLRAPLQAVHIRSDVERRRIARECEAPDLHGADFDARTYRRLRDCALDCLAGGFNTLLDAAFLRAADRRDCIELASRLGLRCVILACTAERSVLEQRITLRRQDGRDASDADLAVLARQLHTLEPLAADEQALAVPVDSADPGAIARVLAALQGPPPAQRA